jgi:hypothetical protein
VIQDIQVHKEFVEYKVLLVKKEIKEIKETQET